MFYISRGMKPPTIEELGIIGCLVGLVAGLVMLVFTGLALYVCIRTGFANPEADGLLLAGVLALAGLWALRKWAAR